MFAGAISIFAGEIPRNTSQRRSSTVGNAKGGTAGATSGSFAQVWCLFF